MARQPHVGHQLVGHDLDAAFFQISAPDPAAADKHGSVVVLLEGKESVGDAGDCAHDRTSALGNGKQVDQDTDRQLDTQPPRHALEPGATGQDDTARRQPLVAKAD